MGQDGTLLIVLGESDAPAAEAHEAATLSGVRVPTGAVKRSLQAFLENFSEIIDVVKEGVSGATVESMDINLAVEADGSIGLLGTGTKLSGKCGITLKIKF